MDQGIDAEKPRLGVTNSYSSHFDGQGSESDDSAQQMEVTFTNGTQRRKSSFQGDARPRRPGQVRKASCFVHGFLQDHRLQKHYQTEQDHPKINEDTTVQSRLLTKRELSNMAFGIRELSKRLSHFQLKLNVKNVFLLTKAHDESLVSLTRDVTDWLLSTESGGPYTVYVEETLKDNKNFDAEGLVAKHKCQASHMKFWTNELCKKQPNAFDIVLALGGDGTVLYASWLFQRVVPPVLAFALGSLGFLTKFDFDSYKDTLDQAFHKGVTISLRLRLEATVMRAQQGGKEHSLVDQVLAVETDDHRTHKPEATHDILNDLVIDRGPNPTMSSIEVFGDHFHITTVQADGIVVATPTGSTAYNLAAGGSLCHPDNPVILLTAICAHTLSFRPIILPDTIVLRLGVPYDSRGNPWVSFDGKERVELRQGDYVTISASRFPFPTVLPLGRGSEDWIDSLSRTLNWNTRQRQKAFKEWK